MAKNDTAGSTGGFFSKRQRKSRRVKRGFVFPDAAGELMPSRHHGRSVQPLGGPHTRRRRHKHRRGTFSRWDVFLGFCAAWTVLIALVVLLELGSDSEWFFVEYAAVTAIEQGTWIIGDQAYMPDGRVMKLEQKTTALSEGRDITSTLGKGPHARSFRWAWISAALFSLPIAVFGVSLLYRRVARAKSKLDE